MVAVLNRKVDSPVCRHVCPLGRLLHHAGHRCGTVLEDGIASGAHPGFFARPREQLLVESSCGVSVAGHQLRPAECPRLVHQPGADVRLRLPDPKHGSRRVLDHCRPADIEHIERFRMDLATQFARLPSGLVSVPDGEKCEPVGWNTLGALFLGQRVKGSDVQTVELHHRIELVWPRRNVSHRPIEEP